MAMTMLPVDDLIGGLAAAAFGETGHEVFVHQFRHQPIERTLAGRVRELGISLHAGCDGIDGVSAIPVFPEKCEKLAALFGLVGHSGKSAFLCFTDKSAHNEIKDLYALCAHVAHQ